MFFNRMESCEHQFRQNNFIFHICMKSYSICLSPSDISFSIISVLIHFASNRKISSFLWLSGIPLFICMYTHTHTHTHTHPTSSYPFILDGHVGCFHILAIVDYISVNIEIHISLQISVFIFFG